MQLQGETKIKFGKLYDAYHRRSFYRRGSIYIEKAYMAEFKKVMSSSYIIN